MRLVPSIVLSVPLLGVLSLAGCPAPAPPAQDGDASADVRAPSSQPAAATPADAPTQASALSVEGAWVRAVPPGSDNSALFLTISNGGSTLARITGASSSAAASVELHTHTEQDGVMKMRRVEALDVAGQGHLHLQPGGDHVMLIGLTSDLTEGATVAVDLSLADGSTLTVQAPVQREAPAGGHHHGAASDHSHEHDKADHSHEHGKADHSHEHDKADHSHEHGEAGG